MAIIPNSTDGENALYCIRRADAKAPLRGPLRPIARALCCLIVAMFPVPEPTWAGSPVGSEDTCNSVCCGLSKFWTAEGGRKSCGSFPPKSVFVASDPPNMETLTISVDSGYFGRCEHSVVDVAHWNNRAGKEGIVGCNSAIWLGKDKSIWQRVWKWSHQKNVGHITGGSQPMISSVGPDDNSMRGSEVGNSSRVNGHIRAQLSLSGIFKMIQLTLASVPEPVGSIF